MADGQATPEQVEKLKQELGQLSDYSHAQSLRNVLDINEPTSAKVHRVRDTLQALISWGETVTSADGLRMEGVLRNWLKDVAAE